MNNELIIKVDCPTENTTAYIIIKGKTTEEVKELFDDYNDLYDSGDFDDCYESYLKEKGVEFRELQPDVKIEL